MKIITLEIASFFEETYDKESGGSNDQKSGMKLQWQKGSFFTLCYLINNWTYKLISRIHGLATSRVEWGPVRGSMINAVLETMLELHGTEERILDK